MNPKLSTLIKSDRTFPMSETWERPAPPKMVCLHHTASSPGTAGDINWWKNDKQPVSTPVLIERDGSVVQIYSSMRWAFHLGLSTANYRQVEAATIGVEIDSWGYLKEKNGRFFSWANTEVHGSEVCALDKPFKGMRYFHRYTPQQVEAVRLLLEHWGSIYGIPLEYVGDADMFAVSRKALAITPGVYSHNSFRSDKTDIHPQPDMIAMLKSF